MRDVNQNLEQLFAETERLAKRVEELEWEVVRMKAEMPEKTASEIINALEKANDAYRQASGVIDEIVALLKADTTITDLATGGVYDHDVRRSGWESVPDAFGPFGEIRPLLMVDDAGGVQQPFGSPVMAGTIYVWGIVPRTAAGRSALADMMGRVMYRLHRYTSPTRGTTLFVANRLGQTTDEDGVMDRVALTAAAVPSYQQT